LASLQFLVLVALVAIDASAQTRVVRQPKREIVVSILDRKLAVLVDGNVIRIFPVAVGVMASPSPVGGFYVTHRIVNPTYYHPGTVIPPGKSNPLGPRWIGLSKKGYGIHGTNRPRSIGRASSHGCIRLRNRDIQELFRIVMVGDAVEIRGERDQQTAEIFGSSFRDRSLAANGDAVGGSY
jgi:lipoprotein-anchoring transpeptidase ErfK/SrfK